MVVGDRPGGGGDKHRMEAKISEMNDRIDGETTTTTKTTGAVNRPSPVRQSGGTGCSSAVDTDGGVQVQSQQLKMAAKKKKMCQSNSTFYVPVNGSDVDEEAEEANE